MVVLCSGQQRRPPGSQTRQRWQVAQSNNSRKARAEKARQEAADAKYERPTTAAHGTCRASPRSGLAEEPGGAEDVPPAAPRLRLNEGAETRHRAQGRLR